MLRFDALWDENSSTISDVTVESILKCPVAYQRKAVVNYFLADNSLQVLEVGEANSGRDTFPALLHRSKVFKVASPGCYTVLPSDTSYDNDLFVQPSDMKLGQLISKKVSFEQILAVHVLR